MNNTNSGGIGFVGLLQLLLIALKLMEYINWSWWLVLAPTLVGIGIGILFFMFFVGVFILAAVMKK